MQLKTGNSPDLLKLSTRCLKWSAKRFRVVKTSGGRNRSVRPIVLESQPGQAGYTEVLWLTRSLPHLFMQHQINLFQESQPGSPQCAPVQKLPTYSDAHVAGVVMQEELCITNNI